jgi:hypothetical protein
MKRSLKSSKHWLWKIDDLQSVRRVFWIWTVAACLVALSVGISGGAWASCIKLPQPPTPQPTFKECKHNCRENAADSFLSSGLTDLSYVKKAGRKCIWSKCVPNLVNEVVDTLMIVWNIVTIIPRMYTTN